MAKQTFILHLAQIKCFSCFFKDAKNEYSITLTIKKLNPEDAGSIAFLNLTNEEGTTSVQVRSNNKRYPSLSRCQQPWSSNLITWSETIRFDTLSGWCPKLSQFTKIRLTKRTYLFTEVAISTFLCRHRRSIQPNWCYMAARLKLKICSSLHWLVLGFLYALFVQWSIVATINKFFSFG